MKIIGWMILFFLGCCAVYTGVKLLAEIWWVVAILAAIITAIVICIRILKNRPKW